jgi:hypothetical protein
VRSITRVRSIKGALRGLPEGSCLYQYTRVNIRSEEALLTVGARPPPGTICPIYFQ